MARLKDRPDDQKAKGFPGKRRSRVERQIAEANKLAALLAASPAESGDRLAPPALLTDPRLAPALAVWRDYVPRLAKMNFFGELDRETFAIFCVSCGEFIAAQQDILDHGYSRNVKTISGDLMPRINPSVERREAAQKTIFEISRRFGLTPLDQFALVRLQAGSGIVPPAGLFPPTPQQPAAGDQPPAPQPVNENLVGILDGMDSPPPGPLQ